MKIEDETWAVSAEEPQGLVIEGRIKAWFYEDANTQERIRLASCAPEMLRMLKAERWQFNSNGKIECPVCEAPKAVGCARNCTLDILLRKASGE